MKPTQKTGRYLVSLLYGIRRMITRKSNFYYEVSGGPNVSFSDSSFDNSITLYLKIGWMFGGKPWRKKGISEVNKT